jgi:hypothetical protein
MIYSFLFFLFFHFAFFLSAINFDTCHNLLHLNQFLGFLLDEVFKGLPYANDE